MTSLGPLRNGADLTQRVDDCNEETAKADAAETRRDGALEGAACGALGHVVWTEIPAAIQARDGSMDDVLDDLADPVHGKGDEAEQTDDLCTRAAVSGRTGWVRPACAITRLETGVDGDDGDRVPTVGEVSRTEDATGAGEAYAPKASATKPPMKLTM